MSQNKPTTFQLVCTCIISVMKQDFMSHDVRLFSKVLGKVEHHNLSNAPKRPGGLDQASSLEIYFGARSSNKRKNLGKFWYHKKQKLGQNYGKEIYHTNFGVISEIQRAKFGNYLSPISLEGKFWAFIQISEAKFGAKTPPPPPDLLIWKYSQWGQRHYSVLQIALTEVLTTIS